MKASSEILRLRSHGEPYRFASGRRTRADVKLRAADRGLSACKLSSGGGVAKRPPTYWFVLDGRSATDPTIAEPADRSQDRTRVDHRICGRSTLAAPPLRQELSMNSTSGTFHGRRGTSKARSAPLHLSRRDHRRAPAVQEVPGKLGWGYDGVDRSAHSFARSDG